jgi:hypothetical protein
MVGRDSICAMKGLFSRAFVPETGKKIAAGSSLSKTRAEANG